MLIFSLCICWWISLHVLVGFQYIMIFILPRRETYSLNRLLWEKVHHRDRAHLKLSKSQVLSKQCSGLTQERLGCVSPGLPHNQECYWMLLYLLMILSRWTCGLCVVTEIHNTSFPSDKFISCYNYQQIHTTLCIYSVV